MVTAGNLDILETWLYQRTGTDLTDTDYTADAPPTILGANPPATPGRPPPPAV
jgi:hypothetical protein